MKKETGFTLLELIVVIAIMGILMAMALPSYRNMQINSKIRTAINEWQGSFYLAQAEAMRIKRNVILCPSTLGTQCNDGVGYEKGWIVAIGKKDEPTRILRDELPLDMPGLKMSLNGNGSNLEFTANGNIRGFQGRTLCVSIEKEGKKAAQRAVVISSEGRIRISDTDDKCSKLSN